MFCPKCRAEYRDGFNICSDCEISLVEILPQLEEEKKDTLEIVTIFETADPQLANIAKSLLDDAEMPYICNNENLYALYPIIGTVIIQVSKGDEKEALELLKDII